MSDQPESGEREAADSPPAEGERVGDALRTAVERTLAATADSAEGTRQRAQDLLDDVVRRGQGAREEVVRRRDAATTKLAEALSELRREDAAGVADMLARLEAVERRLAALEAASYPRANPQVETEESLVRPRKQRDSGD